MAKNAIIGVVGFLMLACLIGLVVSGAKIGWGPFAFIKYNKEPTLLSQTEYKYSTELYKHYNSEDDGHCKMIVYDGQPHVFTGKYKVIAAKDIYKFINNQGENNG